MQVFGFTQLLAREDMLPFGLMAICTIELCRH